MGIGLLAALLFSTRFVVNRNIQVAGGAWEWTASLRYLTMVPLRRPSCESRSCDVP
jgi:hypothetical protein